MTRVIFQSKLVRFLDHFSDIDGITFGHTIRLRYADGDPAVPTVLAHELVHVEQYERFGFVGFLARYVWYTLRYGYAKNPLEVEARERAGQ